MKKRRSLIGFVISLLFHSALASVLVLAVKSSMAESAGGQVSEVDTSISIEMMMAMVQAEPEPEPEPIKEEIPEPKEEIPDPTIKPEPKKIEQPKEPEKPKEQPKPKEKPKEKVVKKERKPPKDAVVGDRDVDSPHQVNSKASGAATNSNVAVAGAGGKAIDAYRSQLRREIERNKRYPQRAKMMRKQGVVTVSFTLNGDGSIQNPKIAKSSGSEDLDNAAIQAVQNARSIGPRPAGMAATVTVPIKFSIN